MWAYWINLLFFTMFGELVVVSYRVTLPVTDLFARNFWCVKGDLGSRLHLEGHTGPMEIRVPKQVTAFIACMFWRFWSPICFRTAVVEACSLTPASISTRTHTLEGFMNQLECTLCIQCSIKCIVSSKYQLSWIRVWFLAAWRPRTAARAYLYTHGLFRLSRWRRILARTGPPDYPVPPCVDHFPRETMGCPHLCMLVYLRINKSWFS
jgi:hypothetical protein